MPAKGYMYADEMDKELAQRYGLIRYNSEVKSSALAKTMEKLITNRQSQKTLIENQNRMINNTFFNKNRNFYTVVTYLFGLTSTL